MIDDLMIDDRKGKSMAKVVEISDALVKRAQDLRVYKQAFQLSLEVHKATLQFPQIEQYALASQMRRASKGICANLAEGFGKQSHSKAEFGRFLSIAIGSANEMTVWCEYALALGYIDQSKFDAWSEGYDHVTKMLQRLRD